MPLGKRARKGLKSVTGNHQYKGFVLDYEDKVSFGDRIPGPHPKYFTVWAPTEDAARVALQTKAYSAGYGLGGVQGIVKVS